MDHGPGYVNHGVGMGSNFGRKDPPHWIAQ